MTTGGDWREFLDAHGAALLLFARQHVASIADAEDALQDVRTKAREGDRLLVAGSLFLVGEIRALVLGEPR